MGLLAPHIARLERMAQEGYIYNIFLQVVNELSDIIIVMLINQHNQGIDGDGARIGVYEPSSIRNKKYRGTFTGTMINLYGEGTWRDSLKVLVIDEKIVISGEPEYLELYFKGKTSGMPPHPWGKGREAIMHLTKENTENLSVMIKQKLKQRI